MFTFTNTSPILRRTLALSAILAASVVAVQAQQGTAAPSDSATAIRATEAPASPLFSSSITETEEPSNVAALVPNTNLAAMVQYGGGQRSRYGRPRYRGKNSNPDGSNKYTAFFGAGLTQPIGNTHKYLNPSYGFQVGVGRQFSKRFALPVEFDYDNFGFSGSTLANQLGLYNFQIAQYNANNGYNSSNPNYITPLGSLDGSSHVWSFSVDPTFTFYQQDKVGAYILGAVGFYHKTATFTTPTTECDPYTLYYYGICIAVSANATYDHYTSNAPGFGGGLGLTYKFSHFSNERFYIEARYIFVDNSQRTGTTINNYNPTNLFATNFYPANSNRTGYIPIKVGIRF